MNERTLGILIVHAAILVIQFALAWLFPTQKRTVFGIYFILLPVGFQFFMPPPPALALALVLGGLVYVFYFAARSAARLPAPLPEKIQK
ncbi:MAG: hypothetical protein IH621_08180 [Krumholzibacteria bacterium]|nr:hypothetical protein [Candidatus Krumholzibacteria bacterium]